MEDRLCVVEQEGSLSAGHSRSKDVVQFPDFREGAFLATFG